MHPVVGVRLRRRPCLGPDAAGVPPPLALHRPLTAASPVLCWAPGANEVFEALSTAVSPAVTGQQRAQATSTLQAWERSAAPGFVGALAQIASQPVREWLGGGVPGASPYRAGGHTRQQCPAEGALTHHLLTCPTPHATPPQDVAEDARLLSVMALKNCVGSSWRKTLSTREWLRVPEAERQAARGAALNLLLNHPSERVATQACLLVANVARFDVPRRWPELLGELLSSSRPGNSATRRSRALKALKHVCRAMAGTRVASGPAALALDQVATQEAILHLLPPIASDWRAIAHASDPSDRDLAARGAAALGHMLRLVPALDTPADFAAGCIAPLLATCHEVLLAGASPNADGALAKLFRRVASAVASAQDAHPLEFAPYLGPFVHVMATAVLALPPDALVEDPRRAHVLTSFLANTLLCPQYKPPLKRNALGQPVAGSPPHPDSPPPLVPPDDDAMLLGRLASGHQGSLAAADAAAQSAAEVQRQKQQAAVTCAQQAFAPLLDGDSAFVRALIERYLCPSPAELEEWKADPHALLQHGEPLAGSAADGGDSGGGDSARPCAETVLLCLLLRDRSKVTATVLALAAQAQATGPGSGGDTDADMRGAMFRDGVYRAIGVLATELPHDAINVESWVRSELIPLLASHAACMDAAARGEEGAMAAARSVSRRLLAARALWLLGRFAEDMVIGRDGPSSSLFREEVSETRLAAGMSLAHDAACACLPHLRTEDPLLALHAAAALRQLATCVGNTASSVVMITRRRALSTGAEQRTMQTGMDIDRAAASAASAAVAPWGLPALSRCLALLPVLADADTAASVLQLCGQLIDTLGRSVLAPHAGTLAAALPAVWAATEARGQGTPGASARVHAALLSTLAHLVRITGTAALATAAPAGSAAPGGSAEQMGGVLFPLLAYATDPCCAASEALLDDGISLWVAALRSCPPGPLHPAMEALTPRLFDLVHRDPRSTLILVCQGYILVGGGAWTATHAGAIASAMAPPLLSTEPGAETALLAACAALDMACQLAPNAVFPHIAPHLRSLCDRLALMAGGDGGGAAGGNEAAAALLPTAQAGKAYTVLLARACLASPDAMRQLLAGRPDTARKAVAVCAELQSLRAMDELLMPLRAGSSGGGRPAIGGGTAPNSQQEDRAVVAAALCDVLRDAASLPGAGADAAACDPRVDPDHVPVATTVAGAMLRALGPAVSLLVVALADVARLTGDEGAQQCLPLEVPKNPALVRAAGLAPPSTAAGGSDPDEESIPNLVDSQAWRLAASDPVRRVALMQRARGALAAVRAACGDGWVQTALEAEDRLRDAQGLRASLLNALLT